MQKIYFGGMLTPEEYVGALFLHNSPCKFMTEILIGISGLYCVAVMIYGSQNLSAIAVTVMLFPLFVY